MAAQVVPLAAELIAVTIVTDPPEGLGDDMVIFAFDHVPALGPSEGHGKDHRTLPTRHSDLAHHAIEGHRAFCWMSTTSSWIE